LSGPMLGGIAVLVISQAAGSFAIGQPRAGDDTTAVDLVTRYEQALVAGQWPSAWEMLAPEQQALSGPFAA
jgi:succinylglutamate desuccinylase